MRCRYGACVSGLRKVSTPQARMSDRFQFSTHWEEKREGADGERDHRVACSTCQHQSAILSGRDPRFRVTHWMAIDTEQITPHIKQDLESGEAIASLMDLANGAQAGTFMRSPNAQLLFCRRLGQVVLNQDQVQDLFRTYVHVDSSAGTNQDSLPRGTVTSPAIIPSYPCLILPSHLTIITKPQNSYSGW